MDVRNLLKTPSTSRKYQIITITQLEVRIKQDKIECEIPRRVAYQPDKYCVSTTSYVTPNL